MNTQLYRIKAVHICEKLKLKDLRESFSQPVSEFSNYEMIVRFSADSFLFVYNYGSVVFFNVPEELQEKELRALQTESSLTEFAAVRANDFFLVEVQSPLTPEGTASLSAQPASRVYFDRLVVQALSIENIKIVCMLLAESTALEYYENLIENLLLKINTFSKSLKRHGKVVDTTKDLVQFIGLCLDTKQEIISNLYIVDSPDETWENGDLDKVHQELKAMLEINVRYRALEYKIQIIQEGIGVIVDLTKSKRETFLEMVIILLISFEILISLIKWR